MESRVVLMTGSYVGNRISGRCDAWGLSGGGSRIQELNLYSRKSTKRKCC